jgi:hypothetical protein
MISSFFISQVLAQDNICYSCQGYWNPADCYDPSCCVGTLNPHFCYGRDIVIGKVFGWSMLGLQSLTLFGVIAILVLTYRISGILVKGRIGSAESSKTSVEKKSD